MQTMVPLYGFGGSGGRGCSLTVTAPAGAAVTISKDAVSKTKTADANGKVMFYGLTTGKWVLSITDGTNTETVPVDIVTEAAIRFTNGRLYYQGDMYPEKTGGWEVSGHAEIQNASILVGKVSDESLTPVSAEAKTAGSVSLDDYETLTVHFTGIRLSGGAAYLKALTEAGVEVSSVEIFSQTTSSYDAYMDISGLSGKYQISIEVISRIPPSTSDDLPYVIFDEVRCL